MAGFLGTHPSAEMPAAPGIGEDRGWGWLVEDNAPPSVTAFANERTISLPFPSRPIVIVKSDQAVVVCSFAAAFASAVAGQVTKHNNPSPAFETARE